MIIRLGTFILLSIGATPLLQAYPSADQNGYGARYQENEVSDQDISRMLYNLTTSNWFSTGFHNVHYDVNEGIVTLSGSTKSAESKSEIEAKVKSIKGVKRVVNNLFVLQE